MLALIGHSIRQLAHSLCSLLRGTAEIYEYALTLKSRFTGTIKTLVARKNKPNIIVIVIIIIIIIIVVVVFIII